MFRVLRRCLLALLLWPVAGGAFGAEPLRLGIMPFNSALALIRTHQPLRNHLQARLDRRVEIFTSADYFTFLNETQAGNFDLVITGPHFGIMAIDRGYQPLVQYQAVLQPVFVVRRDGSIRGLDDLRGRRIGLSSRLSMSSIGGVKWLQDHGMMVGRDFSLYERATHGAAIAAVAVGDLDAALTTHTPLRQVPEDVRAKVTVLPLDVATPHLMTLANKRLGKPTIDRIRQALYAFPATPEGQAFFQETGYQGYRDVVPGDFKVLAPYLDLTRKVMSRSE